MSAHQDTEKQELSRKIAAKGRMISLIIVGTMLLWLLSLWLAPKIGIPPRYALLLDLVALAALAWSFVMSMQLKRARKELRAQE
jgi:xanthine/uracil/vitamin C permease (AzgA family)